MGEGIGYTMLRCIQDIELDKWFLGLEEFYRQKRLIAALVAKVHT